MGKYFKLGLLVVSGFVLVFIIVGVFNGVSNIISETKTPQSNASPKTVKVKYDKIRVGDKKTGKGGMTLAEVEQILGKSTSQTEGKSGNLDMDVYTFATSSGPNSIMITFINGHVSGKTQTGLK